VLPAPRPGEARKFQDAGRAAFEAVRQAQQEAGQRLVRQRVQPLGSAAALARTLASARGGTRGTPVVEDGVPPALPPLLPLAGLRRQVRDLSRGRIAAGQPAQVDGD
jgi:hypothetical protein